MTYNNIKKYCYNNPKLLENLSKNISDKELFGFGIGDTVMLKDYLNTYSWWEQMFHFLNFKNTQKNRYKSDLSNNFVIFTKFVPNPTKNNDFLVGVEHEDGTQLLTSLNNLTHVL